MRSTRSFSSVLFLCATLGLLSSATLTAMRAHADDGALDPTFGSSAPADIGRARIGFGGGNDVARCIARQEDGKYVVGVQALNGAHTEIGIARYFPDGTLDQSFGELGFVRTAIRTSPNATQRSNDYPNAILAGPGWILVAGLGHAPTWGLGNDFVMARYDLQGDLDPTFGDGGRVLTDFFGSSDQCTGMALQADGKILLVGSVMNGSDSDFGIARYTANGQLDATFGGGDGKVNISIGTGDQGQGIAVQDDGKILVTGFANIGAPPSTETTAILRLLSDGTPDPTWDGDGRLTRNVAASAGYESGLAIAIQNTSPQKIVISGIALTQMSVLRYNLNGTPDNTFSGDGLLLVPGTTFVGAGAIGFELTGGVTPIRIFLAGDTGLPTSVPVVVKLDLAGNFDPAFGGGDGIATAPIGTGAGKGLVLAQGDKPVVVGAVTVGGQTDLAVSRLDASGLPDPSFDFDGWRSDDMGNAPCRAAAVVHQTDGKILVAGTARIGGIDRFAVARLNAFGRLDPTFDGDGRVVTTIGDVSNVAKGMALQPDGRIVVVGQVKVSGSPEQWYFGAARYLPDGTLDPAFTGDGTTTVAVYGFADARAVALQPDGKIVIAGSTQFGGNANFALVRLDALGVPDPTFDGDGRISTDMGSVADTARAVLVRPDGTIFVAGSALVGGVPDFAAANYHSNGALDGTFSGDGKATASVDFWSDHAWGCALHGTAGQVVLAGQAYGMKTEGNFGLLQFDIFGVPDPTFGAGGARVHAMVNRVSAGRAVAVLPNGRVLVAGWSRPFDAASDFTVLRLLTNGDLDNTFAGDGSREVDLRFGSDDVANAMSLGANGRVVVAGEAGGVFGLVRLTGVSTTDVGDEPRDGAVAELGLRLAGENPSKGPATIAFGLPQAGEVTLAVYDVRGARVRTLTDGWQPAGRHTASWNGRDDSGRASGPGIYFVRLAAAGQARVVRLVRLGP